MSRWPGKVKNQTPRVEKNDKKKKQNPKKKLRGKSNKTPKNKSVNELERGIDSWRGSKSSKEKKNLREMTKKKELKRFKKMKKNVEKEREEILREYNDFFEFFNLNKLKEYSSSEMQYLEKPEVKVLLVNDEEREKMLHKIDWEKNNNLKLLASISTFPESHSHLEKFDLIKKSIDSFYDFLSVEENIKDKDRLIDLLRIMSNFSNNEKYLKIFMEKKVFQNLINFLKAFKIKNDRMKIECCKMFANFACDENLTGILKTEHVEFLYKLTKGKDSTSQEFMKIFWTYQEQQDKNFFSKFLKEKDEKVLKDLVFGVCEVLEKYPENIMKIEIPDVKVLPDDTKLEIRNLPISIPYNLGGGTMSIRSFFGGGGKVHKPILYFYSKGEEKRASVKLDFPGELTVCIPKIKNWENILIEKQKNGISVIKDLQTNKNYSYLFYEGNLKIENQRSLIGKSQVTMIVKKEDTQKVLSEILDRISFNKTEKKDFLDYWVPVLKGSQKNYFKMFFNLNDTCNEMCELLIEPKPVEIVRLFMTFKELDDVELYHYPQEELLKFDQNRPKSDYYAIEWGGMLMNN